MKKNNRSLLKLYDSSPFASIEAPQEPSGEVSPIISSKRSASRDDPNGFHKKFILLFICSIISQLSLSMEKPPQVAPVYRLMSSDDCEVVVQPKLLKNSDSLKALLTGNFKESRQNKLPVSLPGAALETLVNMMHLDHINDTKGITELECLKKLTLVLHADPNRGEYILDLLAKANEWMVCPMIIDAIATEAAELIFHDDQARAECMQKMSVQDQFYLLNKFSLASTHARNYIPALTLLHGMKNKKEITQDHELDKEWKWSVRCFLTAALEHVPEWAAQSGARTVAEFINSSVLQELDPFFKDKLYKKLEDPECVDSSTVYAMDAIDDTHVVYGGEGTAGILNLEDNSVKDLGKNITESTRPKIVGEHEEVGQVKNICALAHMPPDRFLMFQKQGDCCSLDVAHSAGQILKRNYSKVGMPRLLLPIANQRMAVAHKLQGSRENSIEIIDTTTLDVCQSFEGHCSPINCMLVVGSKLVTASQDCTVRIWNLNKKGNYLRAEHKLQCHCPIYSLLHVGGTYVISCGYNCAMWDIEFGENVTEIGKRYSLVSCDGVNNTYGGKATIASKIATGISLKKLFDTMSDIPNLQVVIPFNRDHLLTVYDKLESLYSPIHAAIRVWNIRDGTVVNEQFIEKDSLASILAADNKIIYGTTTGLMVKHVPQAYPSLTALLERLTLQKP